ncbi:uncharacterized protein F5147DRAFT_778875 [Suillus discolor]|uniref:Uncharacterized protein n=1 Tax=Suillus discolor TaxID=1912936 RepID=A0A9P7EY87_9AGAM|nr:uncharacterized protein F5147DRAFT_778875 [Suillus discolor]KAG2094846.1 hypothetical protein F5147DRAFT_778875 [Suillus discolor]
MVFYAYVKQITDNWSARYVITFSSREVADEWWRAVSTSTVTTFVTSVQRVNAQFYTHNNFVANVPDSLTTTGVATQFLGKVFFTLLNDTLGRNSSIIPQLEHFADHISGNSFFIRSKVAPYDYWYYPQSSNATKAVYVSRTERTRFTVSRTANGTAGTVMIGSDEIVIKLTTADLSVNVNATTAQVILSLAPSELTFSTLLTNFTVGSSLSVSGENVKKLLYTENGEEWELA